MDRRSALKVFPFIGALASPKAIQPEHDADVTAYADAVVAFSAGYPSPDGASAVRAPFATTAIDLYVKAYEGESAGPAAALQPLVDRFRAGDELAPATLRRVASLLWARWKPSAPGWVETNGLVLKKRTEFGLPDRIVTPTYVVDVGELDCLRLAKMLISVRDLTPELEAKVSSVLAEFPDKTAKVAYGSFGVHAVLDRYLLEFGCWMLASGYAK